MNSTSATRNLDADASPTVRVSEAAPTSTELLGVFGQTVIQSARLFEFGAAAVTADRDAARLSAGAVVLAEDLAGLPIVSACGVAVETGSAGATAIHDLAFVAGPERSSQGAGRSSAHLLHR